MYSYATASANGSVVTGGGRLISVHFDPGSTNGSVILYDGTDTDGRKMATLRAPENGPSVGWHAGGVVYATGIYAAFTATTPLLTLVIG